MSTDLQGLLGNLQGWGLRFYHRLIRTLTLPSNAGPGQPRIVIGPDVPAELQAWVGTNFSQHCYFALLGYDVTGGYLFSAYCYSDAIQIPQRIDGYTDSSLTPHLFSVQGWNIVGAAGETDIGFSSVPSWPLNVFSGLAVQPQSAFTADGFSLGRGLRSFQSSVAPFGPSGVGTEMYCYTSQAFDRVQFRAYRVRVFGWVLHSVVGAFDVRIRDGNTIAGATLKEFRVYNITAGVSSSFEFTTVLRHTSATVLGSQVGFTLQSISGGTVTLSGAATFQPELEIDDWCSSAAAPSAESF